MTPIYDPVILDNLDFVQKATSLVLRGGIVEINGIKCIDAKSFAKSVGISEDKIKSEIDKADLPIIGYAKSGGGHRRVAVYSEQSLQFLEYVKVRRELKSIDLV